MADQVSTFVSQVGNLTADRNANLVRPPAPPVGFPKQPSDDEAVYDWELPTIESLSKHRRHSPGWQDWLEVESD